MNLDDINMENVSDILSSLSEDDIEGLKNMAAGLFSQNTQETPKKESTASFSDIDFSSVLKIANLMNLLSGEQKDPRCDLLSALKPMVSDERKQKIDQATKMLRLMSVLPKIKELG